MDKDYNATYWMFDTMTLNDRHVWLQVIDSPVGNIYIVQYERPHPYMDVITKLFYLDFGKAEAYYKRICKQMVDGKI